MSDGPTREEEMFARLAERDLAAVERVHDKLMAAEETADIAELGRTYQRMARSLRQTLALKAKLTREREAAEAARPKPSVPPLVHEGLRPLGAKVRAHIDAAVEAAAVHLERERPDWDELDDAMVYDVLVTLAEEDEDFLDIPVETLVARVLETLRADHAGDEPDGGPDTEPAVQDSA